MKVRRNARGLRIGEGHHKAILTDAEVEALLADRGPDHAPRMSYAQLARKWGLSKSGVAGICRGDRRAQAGEPMNTPAPVKQAQRRVQVRLTLPLAVRAKLHRLGGSRYVEAMVKGAG